MLDLSSAGAKQSIPYILYLDADARILRYQVIKVWLNFYRGNIVFLPLASSIRSGGKDRGLGAAGSLSRINKLRDLK